MQQAIAQDEMARIQAPPPINGLGIGFIGPTIIVHGTEAQKQRYLPRMAEGETRGSFSMSEPDLGSDVAAIKTKAVQDGDEFVLDGAKMWLTNGGTSNLTAVLVRNDEGAEKPYQNLTCFLVEKPVGYGEVAPKLAMPVLMIQGSEDRVNPTDKNAAVLVKVLPQARLEIVDGAGHLPEVEAPDAVNRMLREFFLE
jgi:alkylation response protein AidB-like acyl-CoA dehydrogenase